MIITQIQMAGMRTAARNSFVRRLARHIESKRVLTAHDGGAVPVGNALEARVEELLATAETFGLRSELGLGQFVVLGIAYSRTFHQDARVQRLLADDERSPEESIQAVLNAVVVAERRMGVQR